MAASKYIKTRSNYVLRNQHQVTKDGKVFERDFMTISGSDGMSPSEEQFYRSSNFKFAVRSGLNENRKQYNDDWIKADPVCINNQTTSKDSQIILNPDYESISDFAYYGSSVDMVKSALVDVAMRFPAELFFSDEVVSGLTGLDGTYYLISNDYGIDIYTNYVDENVENRLRYMSLSSRDYVSYSESVLTDECICDIVIHQQNNTCDGVIAKVEITIDKCGSLPIRPCVIVYRSNGNIYYLYNNKDIFGEEIKCNDKTFRANGYHVRPKENIIEEFYNSIDDFEKVLLNRNTVPVYTAIFNTPYETEKGFFTYERKYSWPCTYGWNPDLNGLGYETYVNELIQLAEFYDEYNTNNLWRSMTHEAIKNLDWTFTRINGDDTEEIETIDASKVEPILKIWGRQYDDIKRYIDNIPKSLNVTLDKKNNVPDYFLDDVLNLTGWETTSLVLDEDVTTPRLYSGSTLVGYDSIDASNEFLRRLKVFSPYLLSIKGTRQGLIAMLGLLGFEEDTGETAETAVTETKYTHLGDYVINEKILIAKPGGVYSCGEDCHNNLYTYPCFDDIRKENRKKYNYVASDDVDGLYGLPLAKVSVEHEDCVHEYVIPWYERGKKYDGEFYFQSKGGWGKHREDYQCDEGEYYMYDDTVVNIKTVEKKDDLYELGRYVVKTGDICYVKEIAEDATGTTGQTNYFILEDDKYANEQQGWRNVTEEELKNTTSGVGFTIAYLKSIKNNNQGNNPHSGEGRYDDGNEYIQNILSPFNMANENENLIDTNVVNNFKFSGVTINDNFRVWRFSLDGGSWKSNEMQKSCLYNVEKTYVSGETCGYGECEPYETRQQFYTPETSYGLYDEPASYSIINLKNISIVFRYKIPKGILDIDQGEKRDEEINKYVEQYKDFIKNKVLFYLKQMIPATTIFSYCIEEQK